MSVGRHESRIAVVKTIFAEEFRNQSRETVIDITLEGMDPTKKDRDYIEETLNGIFSNLDEIRKKLAKYAPERPIDDINPTSRAILYLGVYELLYCKESEIPPLVAINEAIEVARSMANETGVAFVNGVLNRIYEDMQLEKMELKSS